MTTKDTISVKSEQSLARKEYLSVIQKKYCSAFDVAEQYIKDAEIFVHTFAEILTDDLQGILFPAVNELRYAGFHAAKALLLEDRAQEESYVSALRHCYRACYDALDIQIQYCLTECRRFQNEYRLISISDVVKNYQDDCLVLDRVKHKEPRSEERDLHWKNSAILLKDLQDIYQRWHVGRDELNKLLEEKRDARWKQFVNMWITGVSAIAVVISSICALYVIFFK